jgi:hypothetical protein
MQGRLKARVASRIRPNCGIRSSGGADAVGLVEVELVAEGLRGIVEDHGEMGGRDADIGVARILQELPQHVAEARDGVDRQPSDLRFSGGSAWKARKMKPEPSTRKR